ncbi:MAG: hypothetical protein AAB553_01275 [Patescibacteria group bacterium]
MKNDTGQFDHKKQEIRVGDLVVLTIPRKEKRKDAVIFEVLEDDDGYVIVYSEKYSNDTLSVGSSYYVQPLNHQVYEIVGNTSHGINEELFS